MFNKYKRMALGCLTYIPGLHAALRRGTGGTNSARYCYSAWMRHLVTVCSHGLHARFTSIAELGPGDSLGIGLSALLCGAQSYVALDTVPHARSKRNLDVFDELVQLMHARAPIPDDEEFPHAHPKLDNYAFPLGLIEPEVLDAALKHERVAQLRRDLQELTGSVRYAPHWQLVNSVDPGTIDMIISQAVLEHVDDIDAAYSAMFGWLKPGGLMSHQIDLKCHDTADVWNGHFGHSEFTWRLIRGRLPYLLNRLACSGHLAKVARAGFDVLAVDRVVQLDGLSRTQLAPRFAELPDEDLVTSGVYMICRRPLAHRRIEDCGARPREIRVTQK